MLVFTLNFYLIIIWVIVTRLLPTSAKKRELAFLSIVFIQFILITGLRSYSVGQDTLGYYNAYQHMQKAGFESFFHFFPGWEPGYVFLNIICAKIGFGFRFFLIVIDGFAYYVIFRFFYRYSPIVWLSVVFFVAFGFFFATLHILRQTIAIAFILLSYDALLAHNKKRFIFYILVAVSFHYTALLFLLSYFFCHDKRISPAKFLLAIGGAIMINSFFIKILLSVASGIIIKFSTYGSNQLSGSGYGMLIMMVGLVLLGYIYSNKQLNSKITLIFGAVAIGAFMQVFSTGLSVFARACWYWQYALMPYIPILVTLTKNKNSELILKILTIIFAVFFFFRFSNTQEGIEGWATFTLME